MQGGTEESGRQVLRKPKERLSTRLWAPGPEWPSARGNASESVGTERERAPFPTAGLEGAGKVGCRRVAADAWMAAGAGVAAGTGVITGGGSRG